MSKVWVVEGGWKYEGFEILHIASSKYLAEDWIFKHYKKDDRYPDQPNEPKVMRSIVSDLYYDDITIEEYDVDSRL